MFNSTFLFVIYLPCLSFQKAALLQLEKDIRTANIKFDETLSCFSLMEAQQLSSSSIFLPETQVSLDLCETILILVVTDNIFHFTDTHLLVAVLWNETKFL